MTKRGGSTSALCACLAVMALGCRREMARAAGEPARTVRLARGEIVDREVLTGELRATASVGLTVPRTDSWQLAIRWLAEDGAMVKAGDRVLEFDNSEFATKLEANKLALLEAEMSFRGAQDLGAIATEAKVTELRQHEIALEKATVLAEVPADLLGGREAQERQLAKKRAEVATEKARHELAAQREQEALELRIKQIELDKARRKIEDAERTIKELVLTAPRDGMVVIEDHPWLGRKFRGTDTVQPGMTVATLPNLGQAMEVRADLSDVDDGRVAAGAKGVCTLDAYPGEPIACTVKDVTPVARSKGESSLRRAFAVVLELAKVDSSRMRPGMSVKIELQARAVPDVVVVPRGAIAAADGKSRVRMASGELRDVTLGACDAQGCAAESGVAAGDAVVLGGSP
jgi:multidrug efflux pump subunit AcrA (membrane-fusion protein)